MATSGQAKRGSEGGIGAAFAKSRGGARNYDDGVKAPRTGRVVPVDKDKLMWRVECYGCKADAWGTTRREAIERHRAHYRDEHEVEEMAG